MAFASGASKAVLLLVCAGCAHQQQGIQLAAELAAPDDVQLSWQGHASGTVVEFATEEDGRYTILEFLPRDRDTFEHPDLMPDTTFYYRVRPVLGPLSAPAAQGPSRTATTEDWLVPTTVADDRAARKPGGAPTNLVAAPVNTDGVLLTWTDNATDEAGYLIEVDGEVVFVVDPEVNSAGLITDDPGGTYRVRAYHFGAPSNVVSERIGD